MRSRSAGPERCVARTKARPRRPAIVFLVGVLASALPVLAVTHEYALEIPSRVPVKFRLDLPVQHPGELKVDAVWSGRRMIALRIDPPQGRSLRRSGLSPLHLSANVDADSLSSDPWVLTIYSMPTSSEGEGTLTVTLPDPPRPLAAAPPPEEARPGPEDPDRSRTPFDRDDLPPSWLRLFDATDRLRSTMMSDDGGSVRDTCRWQVDLLDYLIRQRDRLIAERTEPAESTLKLLHRLSEAIQRVEEFRTTEDSVISGPPPENRELREAWIRVRRDRLQPLEGELDDLLGAVHRGHAPELTRLEWPARMVSCLIACQRHFEERVRVGERQAINAELVRMQWDVLLSAGDALGRLTELNVRTARSFAGRDE